MIEFKHASESWIWIHDHCLHLNAHGDVVFGCKRCDCIYIPNVNSLNLSCCDNEKIKCKCKK